MNIKKMKEQRSDDLIPLANNGSYDACMVLAHRYMKSESKNRLTLACKYFSLGHEIEKNTGIRLEARFASFSCACCFQRLNKNDLAAQWYLISAREGNLSGFFRAAMLHEYVMGKEARSILKEGMDKGSIPCELKYIAMTLAEASLLLKPYWLLKQWFSKLKFINNYSKDEYSFKVRR